jgi:hypothetical protein
MENWKEINKFKGKYIVSNHGRVYSIKNKIMLKGSITKTGYKVVSLGGKNYRIHKLVILAFMPNPLNLPITNHKDGNKTNNHIDNLEWSTYSHNTKHAYDTGLIKQDWAYLRGEKSHFAKLTKEQALTIKYELLPKRVSLRKIAKQYGVTLKTIWSISKGQNWGWL